MNFKNIALVAIGGALGSVARFAFSQLFKNFLLPINATLIINVVGSFIIGILAGYLSKQNITLPNFQLLAIVGFCGGFTTFSAFSLEALSLLQQQKFISFLTYIAASILLCLLVCFIGYLLAKKL